MAIKTTKFIWKLTKAFAKEIKTFVGEGMPLVTPKEYLKRLNACRGCIHYLKQTRRCGLCQCYLPAKAKMKTTVCPDKPPRWETVYIDEDEFKENMKKEKEKYKDWLKKQKNNEKD